MSESRPSLLPAIRYADKQTPGTAIHREAVLDAVDATARLIAHSRGLVINIQRTNSSPLLVDVWMGRPRRGWYQKVPRTTLERVQVDLTHAFNSDDPLRLAISAVEFQIKVFAATHRHRR